LASHRNLGVFAALPLIVMSLTGAGMIFPDAAKALMLSGRAAPAAIAAPAATKADAPDWQALFEAAQAQFPDAATRGVTMAHGNESTVRIRVRQPSEWQPNGRTYISADPASAAVLSVEDALSATPGVQAFNAFYPIHSSRLGDGYGARVYDFVIAIIG